MTTEELLLELIEEVRALTAATQESNAFLVKAAQETALTLTKLDAIGILTRV